MQDRNGLTVTDTNMRGNKFLSGCGNTGISRQKIICCMVAALATVGVVLCGLWLMQSEGFFLPRWIAWKSGTFSDTSGRYEITLKHRKIEVVYDRDVIWITSKDIKVQEAMSCDIDGDGTDELVLLCWKVGRFGASRPFWVEEDERTWSQHIFVYAYNGDKIKPKWMSSYIGVDVAAMSAADRQRLLLTDTDGKMTSWIWDSWGFTKEDTDISFVVFGDNLIHEQIYQYGLRNLDGDYDFLFEGKSIKEAIKESDVAVINQETPFTDEPSNYSSYPRFGTPIGVGEAIADAGFNVVTCATNHILDQGADGVNYTKRFFDSNDIRCIGIQTENEEDYIPYEILTRGVMRFALFNYTYGTNGNRLPENRAHMVHLLNDEEQVRADLERAKSESDFVLVFVHWGTEYEQQPDEFQQKWTQVFLESKVDVVVGTHPHTLQPYEILQGADGHEMLIYYSIGNYISAQPEKSCIKGGMAQFTVSLAPDGYKVTEYGLQPLVIERREDGKYTVSISE